MRIQDMCRWDRFGIYVMSLLLLLMPLDVETYSTSTGSIPPIFGGLAWSDDSTRLAVGTLAGVWIHRTSDMAVILRRTSQINIEAMDWQPNGNLIASGDAGLETVQIWNSENGKTLYTLHENSGAVQSVRWSPDGTKIATTSAGSILHIWDALTGFKLHEISLEGDWGYSVSWTSDSQRVLVGLGQGFVIRNATTGNIEQSWPILSGIFSIKWSPNGEWIAQSNGGGNIFIWNSMTQQLIDNINTQGKALGKVWAISWSPDSARIADIFSSEEGNNELQVWDVASQKLLAWRPNIYISGDGYYDNAVAWSRDGKYLASISDDGKIYIFDGNTYKQLSVYEGYAPLCCLSEN